jgi:hypothetical protein
VTVITANPDPEHLTLKIKADRNRQGKNACCSPSVATARRTRRHAVTQALRNQNVWLAVTYVGLLLLMAHAQV